MSKKSGPVMKLAASVLLPGLLAFAGGAAQAAGFYLGERSIKASGAAFAGAAALSDDASFMSFNPAILTGLSGAQITGGGYIIAPRAVVRDRGSNLDIGPVTGLPVGGSARDQGFKPQPSGYLAAAAPVTNDIWVGLSITGPFGLKNSYDKDYFGRYDSTRSSVMVIDIAPTVAWRVADGVSVGGSLSIQRSSVTLVSAIPNPFDPAGPNAASDGSFRAHGTDWEFGYSVGVLFEPTDNLRVGVSYRGALDHRLRGVGETNFLGMTTEQAIRADLKLPDVISGAVAFDVMPSLTLLAQVNHYGWNRFKQIRIVFPDNSTLVATENFRNTWAVSVGAQYRPSDRLTLRGGVEYDQTPTVREYRSTRLPDTNRLWVALGATYQLMDQLSVDVSYTHLFRKTEDINRTTPFALFGASVDTLGTTSTDSNVFGLGLTRSF